MKHITIVVPECEINLGIIGGTFEILNGANEFWQKTGNKPGVVIQIAGYVPELKTHQGYFSIHPLDIRKIERTDLLIIPAIFEDYGKAVRKNKALINWIGHQYKCGAEIASICSGAFFLAATGLLKERSCSMHWNAVEEFRRMFPNVKPTDKVITDQNGIYTNGGGYSFLNLMLYLIEKFFDRATAVLCSKVFQIDMERTTQSQFSIFHIQKGHGDELIGKAQTYIEKNLYRKISFEKLASQFAISRRNFDRRFIKATGNTPMEYLQRIKMETAKQELEKGRKTVCEIMNDVGYTDDKAFREVFKRITGLSPVDYRNKFNKESMGSW
ncbi:MAG: helix-turn-helix domain-containing protein [Chitinophagaceae bacterium]|nr:helix-turn-helix domain-containing protein [Chitinophagaceae bacterium]